MYTYVLVFQRVLRSILRVSSIGSKLRSDEARRSVPRKVSRVSLLRRKSVLSRDEDSAMQLRCARPASCRFPHELLEIQSVFFTENLNDAQPSLFHNFSETSNNDVTKSTDVISNDLQDVLDDFTLLTSSGAPAAISASTAVWLFIFWRIFICLFAG